MLSGSVVVQPSRNYPKKHSNWKSFESCVRRSRRIFLIFYLLHLENVFEHIAFRKALAKGFSES